MSHIVKQEEAANESLWIQSMVSILHSCTFQPEFWIPFKFQSNFVLWFVIGSSGWNWLLSVFHPVFPLEPHQNGHGECNIILLWKVCESCLAVLLLNPSFGHTNYLFLYNVTVHHSQKASPYTLCTRKKLKLSLLCTFGCHVYALSLWHHSTKLKTDKGTDIFLEYTSTMKNVHYFDITTGQIKLHSISLLMRSYIISLINLQCSSPCQSEAV